MRKIGLIGGISWVSTVDYYKMINTMVNEQLGGLEFSECLIYSFNYGDIKRNNDRNDWDKTFDMLSKACLALEQSGAEAIALCANTMHLIADRLQSVLHIPIIHIAEVTATAIAEKKLTKVALLGTRFTMEQSFFTDKLRARGIEAMIPGDEDRAFIHHTIFEELGRNLITAPTKARYLEIIDQLQLRGAEGVILGCTEIPLLIKPGDVQIPVFDTANIHCKAIVDFQLC